MRAALFDVFGTLLDVYSVTRRAEDMFPTQGTRLAFLWREKQLEYSRLRTMSSRYVPFSQVTRDALVFAMKALQLSADAAALNLLLDEYKRLAPFVDAAPTLERLQKAGVQTGVLSNGDSEMLEPALVTSGLHRYIDLVLSADQVKAFKTSPQVYALGPRVLKISAEDILFVSSNGWEAIGAAWYGYTTFWVNRLGVPLDELGAQPHAIGATLGEAADFLLSRSNRNTTETAA